MKNNKIIIGLIIFALLICSIIGIKYLQDQKGITFNKQLTEVYVATGGGKEDFIADTEVVKILEG